MKRLIFTLTSLLVLACTSDGGFSIEGTAEGFENGTQVFIQRLSQNNRLSPLDTVTITNERFTISLPYTGNSDIDVLTTSISTDRLLLIEEQANLKLTLYKDSITTSLVAGGRENANFYTYKKLNRQRNAEKQRIGQDLARARRETDGIMVQELGAALKTLDEETKNERQDYIRNNPNSLVSVIAISDLVNGKAIDLAQTETFFNGLSSTIKNAPISKSISTYIAKQKSERIASQRAEVGNKAPEFSAPTPEGDELALTNTLGKYTIIDFWASWCRPCRAENPNVVNVYNKYHDQGLNIISVSLDRQGNDARWKKAIEDDQMDWYHVSNLMFWQDPIAKTYGVRSIPATFLLDENGVIVAKNLRGKALRDKMDELFGES